MSVYIELFHGRTSPLENLNDWGTQGPIFGPFDWISMTYASEIRCGTLDTEATLKILGDLVYYDGCYYGDFSIVGEPSHKVLDAGLLTHLQDWDESKAEPPSWRTT